MAYILTIATSVASAMLVFILQSQIKENKKLRESQEKEKETERKKQEERVKALENGVLCLLRKELIAEHEKWTERGYITSKALENGLLMYAAYTELGGNGMMKQMKEEVQSLPIKERVI